MRKAGYTDVERGERGSSEEHLTVTQFNVQAELERLTALEQQTQQKEAEASALDKEIAKSAKKKVNIERIDKIEAKPVMLSSTRVSLEKSECETLAAVAKKFYARDRKKSKLQRALDAANELVKELKAQITSLKEEISALTAELKQYKPVRSKLHTPDLKQENDRLRKRIHTYEGVISRNNLWHFFKESRNKNRNRDDAR